MTRPHLLHRLLAPLLLCLVGLATPLLAPAQDTAVVRPVTASYMAAGGTSHLADTYLTPLRYSGWHAALAYSRMQAPRLHPDLLTMSLDVSLSLDRAMNPVRNATMWGAILRAEWGLMARRPLLPALTVALGGSLAAEGGVLYSARNGNNPASAKGAATLNLTGLAAWHTRLGHTPLTLLWHPSMPLIGAFFSPDYGELYYEIYLGNHSGLVHTAWPGSYFCLDNLVAADLSLGRGTSLRLGYSGRVSSTKASGIVTRTVTHALVIGVSGDWITLGTPAGRTVRAY